MLRPHGQNRGTYSKTCDFNFLLPFGSDRDAIIHKIRWTRWRFGVGDRLAGRWLKALPARAGLPLRKRHLLGHLVRNCYFGNLRVCSQHSGDMGDERA